MDVKPKFPKKVEFYHLIKHMTRYLELEHFNEFEVIETIFQYMSEEQITLYFDTDITAIEESITEDDFDIDLFDEINSYVAPIAPIDQPKPNIVNGKKTIYPRDDFLNEVYENHVVISAFIQNSNLFFTMDENRSTLFPEIYYDEIYCNGEELLRFINDQTQDDTTQKVVTPQTSKGKRNKQEKREDAFKQWLATKADIQITNIAQYQECYLELNEPTRDYIWRKLERADGRLFSSGKDDFFKKQKIISFTKGTGENRYKQS